MRALHPSESTIFGHVTAFACFVDAFVSPSYPCPHPRHPPPLPLKASSPPPISPQSPAPTSPGHSPLLGQCHESMPLNTSQLTSCSGPHVAGFTLCCILENWTVRSLFPFRSSLVARSVLVCIHLAGLRQREEPGCHQISVPCSHFLPRTLKHPIML